MSDFEQLTQGYKKKAEAVDERSTPEARALRIKRLRNLANLSRKEMGSSRFCVDYLKSNHSRRKSNHAYSIHY